MFGWVFLTPAYSDDPLSLAAQEIEKLNNNLSNINEKSETQRLIDIAEDKYDNAVYAKSNMDIRVAEHESAVLAEETALSEKNTAQINVDNQSQLVSTALVDKNAAKDLLDTAVINLTNAQVPSVGIQGVAFRIYPLSRDGNYAYIASNAGLLCQGSLPTFYTYAGDGRICYQSENIIGIFNAKLTIPEGINDVYFAAATDDGSRIYIDGVLESELWEEQGTTWSPYTRHFDTSVDKTLDLEVWWYNGGGPGNMTIGWGYNGIWTGIPNDYLSYGEGSSQEVINSYNSAVQAKNNAQTNYNNKLSVYNDANLLLTEYNQVLDDKDIAHNNAKLNTDLALIAKNNSIELYDQSIIDLNNAILNAKNEYNKQLQFEEQQRVQAAISAAMANQPTVVDPTPEPSPQPSPEQTQPDDPTPTPDSEITNEPTPESSPEPEQTVEPSPEPSPLPSDIDSSPTPEPQPTQTESSPKPSSTNVITEETGNLIANLTSKDTLTNLTPEQKAAVAQGLGIKSEELSKVVELAASNPNLAQALEEFGDRIKENQNAPMPYTLADATTEVATEAFLSDPIGAFTDIDFGALLDFSNLGSDMTDDQREKAQEVIVPVVIAANIVAAAMTRRI